MSEAFLLALVVEEPLGLVSKVKICLVHREDTWWWALLRVVIENSTVGPSVALRVPVLVV